MPSLTSPCRLTGEIAREQRKTFSILSLSPPSMTQLSDEVILSDSRGGHLKRREGDGEALATAAALLHLMACHVVVVVVMVVAVGGGGIIKIYSSGAPEALA